MSKIDLNKGEFTAINDILVGYCDDIYDMIVAEAEDITKEARKMVRANSPINKKRTKKRGRYKRGWSIKKNNSSGHIEYTIYNKTDWQLTHLLENGHSDKYGGFVKAKPHIKPVHDWCEKEYYKRVVDGIKKVSE